jgi:ribose/xylose/arabinose/galactoside ABC-type transport system permease subunit
VTAQTGEERLGAGFSWGGDWVRRQPRTLIAWGLLGVLLTIGFSMSSSFRQGPVLEETLKSATFVGMASAAQFFVVVGGGIDLSVGAVASLAAMVGAVVMNGKDGNIPLAVAATLGLGIGVGLANGVLVNYLRIAPFIATFGVYYILTGVAFTWSVQPIGVVSPSFYNLYIDTWAGLPALLVLMAVFWAICWYVARQTAFGRHLYALGGDREASRLAGVRTTRISIASYVVCSVIAASAGLIELTETSVGAPDLGATLLLATVTAVVIGGVSLFGGEGSVIGVLGGVLVLQFLSSLFDALQINALYQQLIEGLIIIGILAIYRQKARS